MLKNNMNKKIAVFFGGKITHHLRLLRMAARKMGVKLDLISYNRVCFDDKGIYLRGDKEKMNERWQISEYGVLFFRTTGKHWEEVDLINYQLRITNYELKKKPIIVDPLVEWGKPSMACKAYQMLELRKAEIGVPKTIYGSLWYLFEYVKSSQNIFCGAHALRQHTSDVALRKNNIASDFGFQFPIILKGSGGDRGTRVFKINNIEEMEKKVRELRKSETEEGKRYMLQEFIPNTGDYRLLVLGKKVLGVMKRSSQSKDEFRNNYSVGGKVEVADLPMVVKEMAVKAAKVCGLMVAGVDVMKRPNPSALRASPLDRGDLSEDEKDYVVLEVNKGPQFSGFMKATGIDVPKEIIKFLISL